ncbi:hypothetical protein [Pendulispora albinea]|uniref:Uncharacterized protein n=1 Tax=Pendulispora albinea TaxID=2741071 RepID=A0ABZ2M797_9BACT
MPFKVAAVTCFYWNFTIYLRLGCPPAQRSNARLGRENACGAPVESPADGVSAGFA